MALKRGRGDLEVVDVVLLLLPPIELTERLSSCSLPGTGGPLNFSVGSPSAGIRSFLTGCFLDVDGTKWSGRLEMSHENQMAV